MRTLYLDMDGVVADFDAKVSEILGYTREPYSRYPDEDWRKILNYPRFYRDLPLCKDAKHLVTSVLHIAHQKEMDVKFLSALPQNNDFPWAPYDKVLWAQNYFPMIPVWIGPYSRDKQIRSKPGDILIDDRQSNIDEWNGRGGFAILHRGDVEVTLKTLRSFVNDQN